ncbi:MAG: RsiV family protein [Bacteroidaceae bacterium]|nr:RsiV family protein [Bacteroidaceae bacterium]
MEQLTEKPIESETEEDSVDFGLLHEAGNRELDVKVDMQFLKTENVANEKVCNLINEHLIELLLKQSSQLSIDEAVEQYIEDVKADFRSDEIGNAYHEYLTGRAEYGMENVINYRLLEEVFTGGAHPSQQTTILRFNAQTGEFITLDQVFPTLNQSLLQERLLVKLMKDQNAHSMEELHKKGILEMSNMFISNNFALRDDSIEFYYNEYDIAPYASGANTICLSYDDVKDIISTTWENRK